MRRRVRPLIDLPLIVSSFVLGVAFVAMGPANAQQAFQLPGSDPPSMRGGTMPPPGAAASASSAAPSPTASQLSGNAFARRNSNGSAGLGPQPGPRSLPQTAGQISRTWDLRPYTGYLTRHDHPEQAVIDWILRETGTDVWFTPPFGFLNATRDQLTAYHTPEMVEVVDGIVNRFVAGEKDPQVMHMRVMTVGSPNWRSRAHTLMQHVTVEAPGVQAWLMSKENAALVMNLLRQRTDTREVQDLSLITYNGQTEKLSSIRGRNYVRNVRPALTGWPPYEPETGEVKEGYQLALSPLLSTDGKTIDCVIKAEIDQVDKLNHVELELPLPNNQMHRTRIDVPQVVSWRLHERFRWPADMVLLLSCGVVASPERPTTSQIPFLNMSAMTGATPGRADALLFLQYRGASHQTLSTDSVGGPPQTAVRPGGANRGRY